MDQNKLINTYVQKLADNLRNVMVEKVMLESQLALVIEELNELKARENTSEKE